jgi:hypothetical protein
MVRTESMFFLGSPDRSVHGYLNILIAPIDEKEYVRALSRRFTREFALANIFGSVKVCGRFIGPVPAYPAFVVRVLADERVNVVIGLDAAQELITALKIKGMNAVLASAKTGSFVEGVDWLIEFFVFIVLRMQLSTLAFPHPLVPEYFSGRKPSAQTFVTGHAAVAVQTEQGEVRAVVIGRIAIDVVKLNVSTWSMADAAGVHVGRQHRVCILRRYWSS